LREKEGQLAFAGTVYALYEQKEEKELCRGEKKALQDIVEREWSSTIGQMRGFEKKSRDGKN